MSYESSYDTSGGPFRPNKDRGLWSRSSDFFFACLCNVVRMDCLYGTAMVPLIANGGIFTFIPCTLSVLLYSLPIVFIQIFLGQFSSSGFISVFRISPLFKGLGYIGLVVNLFSLAFFSIFAAIPLLIFFHSLQPTLPWSCEGFLNNSEYNYTHCSKNFSAVDNDTFIMLSIPSVEYFVNILSTFSFSLFGCVLAIWIPVAFALYSSTETIGRIFRYCTITLCSLLLVVFVRMAFIPSAKEGLLNGYAQETTLGWGVIILASPMLMLASFGPGWGTVLSLASYNKFKTNVTKFSVMICFSQFGVMLLIGLLFAFTEAHLTDNNLNIRAITGSGYHWMSFLAIPSSLASLEYPHLWTWMFLAVLIIGSFNLVIVQMFSVLTALFDEFEQLRMYRKEVIFGISVVLALVSAVFCTENSIEFIEILSNLSILSQALLNLILLLVVVWIYGRERFQRDVEFMTSQVLATWKVFVVRFVTPLFIVITLFIVGVLLAFRTHNHHGLAPYLLPLTIPLQTLPWLILPGYCVYKLMQTTGPIGLRFRRCTRPNDWYPIDPEDRQRYDETVNVPETSHPLTTIVL